MSYKYSYTVIPLDNFGDSTSPARTMRHTTDTNRKIWINLARWRKIRPEHRVFILLHEVGHNELDTSDEVVVDAWAQNEYIKLGYPLTESVFALTRVLSTSNAANRQRCWQQYQRAKAVDDKVNKFNDFDGFAELANSYTIERVTDSFDGESIDVEYSFFDLNELDQVKGLGRKETRKKKRSVKLYKKLQRGKKKSAVALDIEEGAKTRKTYADKGIYVATRAESVGGAVSKTVSSIAGAVAGAFGGSTSGITDTVTGMVSGQIYGNSEPQPHTETPKPLSKLTAPTLDSNKKALMYGGGGLAALLVLGLIISK